MGVQNLKKREEFLTDKDAPKMLLVIGNGFDLSCDVQSNYISFFKWILEKKITIYNRRLRKRWL